ncbi:piriformospora indica-insensitive protein 2 [Andrographis paniculata]|uniref:piriformospora indica-insensitive protein 2 n=1 Tax=Andrographis paniculata TaxID=175694 RepID=UPI0021E6F64A|nr:piriformospora indica-insensitive protein 2 [Andrographis paniculata]
MKYLSSCILGVFFLNVMIAPQCRGQDGSAMRRREQEAVYSAIQGFVGKWWNGSDLYPDPCGWTPIQGVSCDLIDGFWYVTDLSIGPVHENSLSCAMEIEFSPDLFSLSHLKSLSFFSCFHRRPVRIPTQNWELLAGSLESLEFRSNPGLTGSVPVAFGELKNLQSLVLMDNGLSGELPEVIGNLTALKRLNLAGNSFTGGIPDSYGKLDHLLILDISRNSLTGFLPGSFGCLNSLLKLDLSSNKLQGSIPDELGNLKNLTLMDLSNNRLSGGLPKSFQEMSSLQELVVANNPTGGDIMSIEWQKMRALSALDLANTNLTGGIPDAIAELKGLRFLGLNDNNLTGEISPKLANLPNIASVYIHGNNLTGELRFSEGFYSKLGRRFGAWGNPNLCLSSAGEIMPFGVKLCDEIRH